MKKFDRLIAAAQADALRAFRDHSRPMTGQHSRDAFESERATNGGRSIN